MRRLTGRTGAAVALVTAALLVFVSVGAGLRVPGVTSLDPFRGSGNLDYRALRIGSFAPLRVDFIASELGSVIGGSVLAAAVQKVIREQSVAPAEPEPVVVAHKFTNDRFESAYPVTSVPFTAKTNTSGATQQPGEPTECAPVGGTAWYRYQAPRTIGLIASTYGSRYATALGVFSGTKESNLRRIGCDTDTGGYAQVAFAAKRGVTYWFQIAGPVGGGDLVFNLTLRGVTRLASISSKGVAGNSDSLLPAISADGRFISFYSGSNTFTPDNPPPSPCIPTSQVDACRPSAFVRDRQLHSVVRVDATKTTNALPLGYPADQVSIAAGMSGDGRYIGFYSTYSTLVPGDMNQTWDVFVRDRITGKIVMASVSSAGVQGDTASFNAALSDDGRYVAFTSSATNLVPGDTNVIPDVFVHDMRTGRTVRASVSTAEEQANDVRSTGFPAEAGSHLVSLSGNGRFVLYRSVASNLVPGDTNNVADYFLRDLRAGTTKRISVSSNGAEANADSRQPLGLAQWVVSNDGRYVFFNSDASNLVAGDSNGAEDLFLRDTVRGITRRVSLSSSGAEGNRGIGEQDPITVFRLAGQNLFVDAVNATQSSFSTTPGGRYLAFSSAATNLVPGDTNEATDVFLRDMWTGKNTMLSVSTSGNLGNGSSSAPVVSADGRFIVFQSAADNLVAGDTNASEDIFTYEVPHGDRLSGWF